MTNIQIKNLGTQNKKDIPVKIIKDNSPINKDNIQKQNKTNIERKSFNRKKDTKNNFSFPKIPKLNISIPFLNKKSNTFSFKRFNFFLNKKGITICLLLLISPLLLIKGIDIANQVKEGLYIQQIKNTYISINENKAELKKEVSIFNGKIDELKLQISQLEKNRENTISYYNGINSEKYELIESIKGKLNSKFDEWDNYENGVTNTSYIDIK